MPEPFKNLYDETLIRGLAGHLARVSSEFDREVFLRHALNGLEALEMMERAEQISQAIDAAFPDDFALKSRALVDCLHPREDMELGEMKIDENGVAGWAVAAMARVIPRHGLDRPEESLEALKEMTKRFSSEFSVRPFFRDHQELSLKTAMRWAEDENVHVRRLASEGSRPLLPWGIKLHSFVEDPGPLLPLLNKIKDDPEEYVRRSVANNLNDIAKSHPDRVADIATEWLKEPTKSRQRLVKHACRTLIKNAHPGALAAFGYTPPVLRNLSLNVPDRVELGETLPIELKLESGKDQKLLIDYVIHFMRANGSLSPKVFKWTEISVSSDEQVSLSKSHPYRKVTTRKDYPGRQLLSVQINGKEVARREFDFTV